MKIKVRLKDNVTIQQPLTKKTWKYGYIAGFTVAGDDRPYSVVLTEHGEFELVPIYSITGVME